MRLFSAPDVLPQHIASCRSPGAIAVMAALVDRCTVNGEEVASARRHLRCPDNHPDHILGMRRGCRVPVAAWVCDYDVVVLGCGVR